MIESYLFNEKFRNKTIYKMEAIRVYRGKEKELLVGVC